MLSQPSRIAKKHFETESSVRTFVAVRGMVKTKLMRASMESLPVSFSNCSECQYCSN